MKKIRFILGVMFVSYANICLSQNTNYGTSTSPSGRWNANFGAYAGDIISSGGEYNSNFGVYSGQRLSAGDYNSNLGYASNYYNSSGSRNTAVGAFAGYKNTGSGNVFIGYQAGYNQTSTSNRLHIDNSSTSSPLIWGDFGANKLNFNASVGIGTTSPSYKLHTKGDIYADGGWMRVSGQRGIYFQSYGGGLYMVDATWIRTYGNKSFYHNTGTMRTDGIFQVGPSGNRFLVGTNGNIGMGVTSPSDKLDINGTVRVRSLPTGSSINNVVVADGNGKLHIRDASSISGGVGTDDQKIDVLSFSGTTLSISLEDDGEATRTVNLVDLQDGYEANTDGQILSLSGNDLTISGGNTISLSTIDTNTQLSETEVDAFVADNGYLISETDDQTAVEVTYDNTTSGLTAANTQDAVDEVVNLINSKQGSRWTETNGNISYADSVSIGTTDVAKGYLLSVAGNAIMEEVNVKLKIEWPDYVFEESYELQSLEETENYISKNKHLPNVPSAQEVEDEGINLGAMNAALLKKVEELTLHLIDQNKKIETLLERVDELEAGN
ncbi:MAG: shufflon system plasmid conjugative transfer pilus tip adhesin PilV [Reichenbachiella sp.]|uniref:shufflon system plasmid conjugative transfer pilus tip adhesin PilV n=1 Tax=Reichenbachiella sp. TaxID=2184521 RepID=UPI003267D7BD